MTPLKAVVFGGSGAIGYAICVALAQDNYEVLNADLPCVQPATHDSVHPVAEFVECDVTKVDSVRQLFERRGAGTSVVVYAAGVNYTGPVATTDWDAYQKLQDVNLKGAFHVAAIAEELSPPEAFVFLGSTAGLQGEAGGSVYCSTKFGLIGFAQSFAAEIGSRGGRANVVCPGNVDSPLLRTLADSIAERESKAPEQVLQGLADSSAFHRLIGVDEVAQAVLFLASSRASGISGQTLVVDGATA